MDPMPVEAEETGTEEDSDKSEEELESRSSHDGEDDRKPLSFGNGTTYWDHRYETDLVPFEWLENWNDLRPLIDELSGGDGCDGHGCVRGQEL